jgi:protein O-GlcNAc transferase
MLLQLDQAFAMAFAHERAGRMGEARAIYAQILAAVPGHPGALLKLAEHDLTSGALAAAEQRLEQALAGAAAQSLPAQDIWFTLARLHLARDDFPTAGRACERALQLAPEDARALRLAAWLALERGEAAAALAHCRRGLAREPRDVELLHLAGRSLKATGAFRDAYRALAECVAIAPENAGARISLGAVCLDLGLPAEARDHLTRGIAGGERTAEAHDNLGIAHRLLGNAAGAIDAFTAAVALKPELTPALSNLVGALRAACAWDEVDARERQWRAGIDAAGADARCNPFVALAITDDPALQLAVARSWSAATLPAVAPSRAAKRENRARLRIGYLSSDFHDHATAYLVAGLFEQHDRARFETFLYSYGHDDGGPMRRRLAAAVAHWRDLRALGDADAARAIAADELDVLVDLKGHTHGARLGILAYRPAPVQVHYLGYPGTLGFDGVDAIVADEVVVPVGDEGHYHERVLRLPRCYQVNDGGRALPPRSSRAWLGLPDDALVLACFNQTYKLSRRFFATWMAALASEPRAVLWLLVQEPLARANLMREAGRAGIDPTRLVFASPLSQDEHIARLRAADLVVDVLPYGSHTTGSDALWAGVPLLTCRGATFAGRVGASLLQAVGLADLVTTSLDEYEAALLRLIADPRRLAEYSDHLERGRGSFPLFDTEGFTRDFERLLVDAVDGRRRPGTASG